MNNYIPKNTKASNNSVENEEILDKISMETFCQANNSPIIFDDPLSVVRIVLLRAKPNFTNYFSNEIYAIYARTENQDAWFGTPVKNPNAGLVRWNKEYWDKLYGFVLSLTIQEDSAK